MPVQRLQPRDRIPVAWVVLRQVLAAVDRLLLVDEAQLVPRAGVAVPPLQRRVRVRCRAHRAARVRARCGPRRGEQLHGAVVVHPVAARRNAGEHPPGLPLRHHRSHQQAPDEHIALALGGGGAIVRQRIGRDEARRADGGEAADRAGPQPLEGRAVGERGARAELDQKLHEGDLVVSGGWLCGASAGAQESGGHALEALHAGLHAAVLEPMQEELRAHHPSLCLERAHQRIASRGVCAEARPGAGVVERRRRGARFEGLLLTDGGHRKVQSG